MTFEYDSIKNETFFINAKVSKGCEPIIELKLYSSLDYPFDGKSNQDKCKIPTKRGNSPYKTLADEKSASLGDTF